MTHLPVHRCECRLCQSPEPHPDQAFHHYMNVFLSRLNEPQRRWFVALEAMRLGHGGKHLLAQITGMSLTTILRGRHELEADLAGCPEVHLRAPGGGRPAAEERDPRIGARLGNGAGFGNDGRSHGTTSQGQAQFITAAEYSPEEQGTFHQPSDRLKAAAQAEVFSQGQCAAYRSPGCFCGRAS